MSVGGDALVIPGVESFESFWYRMHSHLQYSLSLEQISSLKLVLKNQAICEQSVNSLIANFCLTTST